MSDASAPCPKLTRVLREKVGDCPEDIGHVIGWILTIGSGAQAIGMASGPIAGCPPISPAETHLNRLHQHPTNPEHS